MVDILDTDMINAEISGVCENARKHLLIICPFLKINDKLKRNIESTLKRGVKLTIIYGKRELDEGTLDWIKGLSYWNVGFLENLHAKIIMNEEAVVLSSMNLYEYSQVNNHELGVFAWIKEDKDAFKDILFESIRIINSSTKQYGKWDIGDIDKPLQRKIHKEKYFIEVTETTGFGAQKENIEKPDDVTKCHCIRCGRVIPSYHDYVYCGRCFESWKQYNNTKYVENEGHCYICGKSYQVSAERPACPDCYRANPSLVKDKCNFMNHYQRNKND